MFSVIFLNAFSNQSTTRASHHILKTSLHLVIADICSRNRRYPPLWTGSTVTSSENYFSVLHVNIRSISKNFEKLKDLLANVNLKFKIICLKETWCKDEDVIYKGGFPLFYGTVRDGIGTGWDFWSREHAHYKKITIRH